MNGQSKNHSFVFFLLLLVNLGAFSQITFDNPQFINKKSGLSIDKVNAILKDELGFMWFSTDKGLCRWDGISARAFEHMPNDSSSISGNYIPRNAFVWDTAYKQILLATENGLSFFDPYKLTFKNFISISKSTTFLTDIQAIFIDRQGIIWLGTNTGIVRFGRDGLLHQVYNFSENVKKQIAVDNKLANCIFDIAQDIKNDSVLWLATLDGLLKFNKYSEEFTHFCFESKKYKNDLNTFNKITAHSNRKLYLGTWNADMLVFNTANEEFEFSYGPYSSNPLYFLSSPLVPYLEKSENELWVSSPKGVGIFNTTNNNLRIIKIFKNAEGNNYAPGIAFQDKAAIWLGSEYGAIRFQISNRFFSNYFIPPVDEKHWFLTSSFYEDISNKRLYIGYNYGQGLHYFNLQTNTFHYIPISGRILKENIIRSFLPLNREHILILCPDEICKLSLTNQELIPLHINFTDYPNFTDIASDSKEKIWVCGSNSGLQQLDIASGNLYEIDKLKSFYQEKEVLPKILGIVIDNQNNIWFRDKESYGFYNPESDSLHYFSGENALIVLSFFKGSSDTIWTGTYKNGVGFINPLQAEKGVQIIDSTMHKSIISLQKDRLGNFFMLTASGIEKWKTGQTHSIVFNENEGLVKFDKWANRDPTLPGKLFKLSDGRFVIGYRRGLGFFNPDSLRKTDDTFTPYLSSIKISGKEIPVEGNPAFLEISDLMHDQNSLTFEYSALALDNGKDIWFHHRLTGVEQEWASSSHRNVNYSNLQPGEYQFIVKAESKSTPGLVKQVVLNFSINPPWWSTWWAIAIYLLVFVGIIYSIYRYQLDQVLTREETSRLRELDRIKSQLYTNITHEFRTPLTVIKGMVDEIIANLNLEEQRHFSDKLEMIERNSDKLLHLVQQMLDMSKIEDGKMKLNLIQDNIVSYLQYVLESFQSMADAKNIKLVFYHETDRIVMDYDQDKIFVIASNLLSNAIKFTAVGGKVIFHVKREEVDEKTPLVIKVQDSGIGINKEHLQHIFDRFYQVDHSLTRKSEGTGIGLALTKELVELMNGEIIVKSTPGKRTEFCVTIPITNNALLQKTKPVITYVAKKYNDSIEVVSETVNDDLPLALVVEDNSDVAKYIISCLAGKYRVSWSPDGKQGIEEAVRTIPDIIISDVMMPEKDGFEVCEILKQDERTSHIPIVLLTAKATEKDRIEGLSLGADAYLTKPFNKKELFVRLEQLIRIRKALQIKYSKIEINFSQKTKLTGEERFLKKAVATIEQNLNNPELNAAMLAENLNMSESQLYRKLKALSNRSISVFIRGIRLSAAKRMLETSEFNISEIAYQSGFSDPAWFSRSFKEEYGISPRTFRK